MKTPSKDDELDRLPPHSTEAEQGVIGCCLISPQDCLDAAICKIGERPEAFYDLRHQQIWSVLVEMADKPALIDLITLQQRLRDKQLLEQIGGLPYLSEIQDSVPSAANLPNYLEIVSDKFTLRRLIQTCYGIAQRAVNHSGSVFDLVDESERLILKIARPRSILRADIRELVQRATDSIEAKFLRNGAITGLSTGFHDLDGYTDGLLPGELIVPCAYPSVGKTSLLMNMVESVTLGQGKSALIFSLEMTAESLVTRFLCSTAKVNLRQVSGGYMVESDMPKLVSAAGRTAKSKIFIVDDVESITGIRAEARRFKNEYNVDFIGVDYIQRVQGCAAKGANREQEVASVSSGLKSMAQELRVPVVAPSQLNDDGQLRESRAIGNDADQIWELKRKTDSPGEEAVPIELWIRKQRNGPRGVCVNLTFLTKFTRFESAAKISDEDCPQHKNH